MLTSSGAVVPSPRLYAPTGAEASGGDPGEHHRGPGGGGPRRHGGFGTRLRQFTGLTATLVCSAHGRRRVVGGSDRRLRVFRWPPLGRPSPRRYRWSSGRRAGSGMARRVGSGMAWGGRRRGGGREDGAAGDGVPGVSGHGSVTASPIPASASRVRVSALHQRAVAASLSTGPFFFTTAVQNAPPHAGLRATDAPAVEDHPMGQVGPFLAFMMSSADDPFDLTGRSPLSTASAAPAVRNGCRR